MKCVNTAKWKWKVRAVERIVAVQIPILIHQAGDEIIRKAMQNLSGPQITPGIPGSERPEIGKMPVPRRGGMLAGSMKRMNIAYNAEMIYADENEAPYAKWVHWGTRRMKPRRFLQDVAKERAAALVNRWRYTLKKAVRKVGLA